MPHFDTQAPGEGWLDALFPSFSWMQVYDNRSIAPLPDVTNLPTVVPESVRTAETCFRKPDGWIICVPLGIWADSYRNQGYEEIPSDAPEFLPTIVAPGTYSPPPTDVVSSHPSEVVPEDEETVAVDWGSVFTTTFEAAQDWFNPAVTPIYNFAGPGPTAAPPAAGAPMVNGTCGKSPCVCGVDSCGRPALIDPRTGKRCYKKRRPKLLSDGDFNSLMRIATLPNNQNVRIALAKAIGRR